MWLVSLVLLTGIADLATFLFFKQFHIFEINPLFILTKSAALLVAIKIFLLLAMSFLIYKGWGSRHGNFMLVMSSLYIILFQAAGAYSNCQVAAANPPASAALEPAKATATYLWVMLFNYVIPLVIGTLAYWIFDLCGYDQRRSVTICEIRIKKEKGE